MEYLGIKIKSGIFVSSIFRIRDSGWNIYVRSCVTDIVASTDYLPSPFDFCSIHSFLDSFLLAKSRERNISTLSLMYSLAMNTYKLLPSIVIYTNLAHRSRLKPTVISVYCVNILLIRTTRILSVCINIRRNVWECIWAARTAKCIDHTYQYVNLLASHVACNFLLAK